MLLLFRYRFNESWITFLVSCPSLTSLLWIPTTNDVFINKLSNFCLIMLLYVCLSIFFFFSLFLLEHCFAPIDSLSLLYINIIPYGFSIRMLNLGLYMGLEFRRVSGGSGTGRGRARQQDGRENIRNGDRKAPTPLCYYCLYLITTANSQNSDLHIYLELLSVFCLW